MIDLTPLEVRKKKGDFRKALRGYEPALVDDFLDLVADRLDQLVRENGMLQEQAKRLEAQVSDNRERERALTDALVTAQEMREEIRQQSAREAELTRRTAEQQAAQIRNEAVQAREREEDVLRRLRARQQQLLQSYRTFLAREMAELQVIGETLDIENIEPLPQDPPRVTRAAPSPQPAAPHAAPARHAPPLPPAQPAVAMGAIEVPVPSPDVDDVASFDDTDLVEPFAPEPVDDEPFAPEPVDEWDEEGAADAAMDADAAPPAIDVHVLSVETVPDALDMFDALADDAEEDILIVEEFETDDVGEPGDDGGMPTGLDPRPEPEIGAPDHDATVLLENALRAGYRLDLEDDESVDEILLLDEGTDAEDDGPPSGWLDTMIDDEER